MCPSNHYQKLFILQQFFYVHGYHVYGYEIKCLMTVIEASIGWMVTFQQFPVQICFHL